MDNELFANSRILKFAESLLFIKFMIKAGVGRSSNVDALKAGAEACREAMEKVGGGQN